MHILASSLLGYLVLVPRSREEMLRAPCRVARSLMLGSRSHIYHFPIVFGGPVALPCYLGKCHTVIVAVPGTLAVQCKVAGSEVCAAVTSVMWMNGISDCC